MNNIQHMFKDKYLVDNLVKKIQAYEGKVVNIMEVCGTHTMSISRFGIRSILPKTIRLISGPGCPVCVTPSYYVKSAIELAQMKDTIITTFGDMMRIPYKGNSLLHEKALGRDIRIVYSPLDNIQIAQDNPDKKVIFLSVGFETTTPIIALSVIEAVEKRIDNYMLLTANKTMPQVMNLLSSDKEISIDGYIYPGHVSVIIGTELYDKIADKYSITGAIAGFEPVDILGAIYNIISNVNHKSMKVNNTYSRVVSSEGNMIAKAKIEEVFEHCDAIWRGIGCVSKSGLRLKDKYVKLDAWKAFRISENEQDYDPKGCRCGDILKGKCLPYECSLYGKLCTPENPVGSCMVSSEGTCSAYYKYI